MKEKVWKDASKEKPKNDGMYLVFVEGCGGAPDYCDIQHFSLPYGDFGLRVKYWMDLPLPPAGAT